MYADSYNVQLTIKPQNGRVSGCITDSDGLPVIGASILVKVQQNGIISDLTEFMFWKMYQWNRH